MHIKPYLTLFLTSILFSNCTLSSKNNSELVEIDATKNYPEKEVNLKNICDITYVKFDSSKDHYLFRGNISSITQNTILATNPLEGDVCFFSKDGQFKSHFNRIGNAPEEYSMINSCIYDEQKNEIFITEVLRQKIKIYNSTGEYKRTIDLPEGCIPTSVMSFDEESLLLYDSQKNNLLLYSNPSEIRINENSDLTDFILISKIDGKVLQYIPVPADHTFLLDAEDKKTGLRYPGMKTRIVRHKEGFLLFHQETDTMFYYTRNHLLQPIAVQNPSVKSMNIKSYMQPFVEISNYQFFERIKLIREDGPMPASYLMRDKKTGEIYTQNIVFDEFKEKEITLSHTTIRNTSNSKTGHIMFTADELTEAYQENRLSGELKELVKDMDEEDNGILVLLHFK